MVRKGLHSHNHPVAQPHPQADSKPHTAPESRPLLAADSRTTHPIPFTDYTNSWAHEDTNETAYTNADFETDCHTNTPPHRLPNVAHEVFFSEEEEGGEVQVDW